MEDGGALLAEGSQNINDRISHLQCGMDVSTKAEKCIKNNDNGGHGQCGMGVSVRSME